MFAVIRCLLLAVLMLVGFSAKADTGGYKFYTDYAGNIYLEAPKKFILIHGEVSVPLSLTPANGLLRLIQDASGWRYEVLTQAQWNALELTAGHKGVASVELADFNGDGKPDIRVNFTNLTSGSLLLSDVNGNLSVIELSSANNGYDPIDLPATSSLPANIVGLAAGEFRVDESGGATYQLPLSLPAGIAGVQPQLGFTYNSNGGEGYMGTGWSFAGSSAIVRCPKNIAVDGVQGNVSFASSDRLCLDGQRLVASSSSDSTYWSAGTYYAEIDNSSVIRSHGSTTQGPLGFTVETKSGEIHYYGDVSGVSGNDSMGKTLAASFKAADGSTQTGSDAFFNTKSAENIARIWALKAIKDVKGNYIVFKYAENLTLGEHYLTEVHYTGRINGQAPFATVRLEYGENPKKAQGWQAGVPVAMTRLLNRVHVKIDNEYYRHYQLNYRTSNFVEEKNYLGSVQECADNLAHGCLPATLFSWTHPDFATTTVHEDCPIDPETGEPSPIGCEEMKVSSSISPFVTTSVLKGSSEERFYHQFIDIDGDGLADMVYPRGTAWRVRLNTLNGTSERKCVGGRDAYCYNTLAIGNFGNEIELSSIGISNKDYLQTIDYDGDGRRDLLVSNSETENWHVLSFKASVNDIPGDCGKYAAQCNYLGTYTSVYTEYDTKVKAYGLKSNSAVADFDGDGLEDIVFIKDGKFQVYKNRGAGADGKPLGMELIANAGAFDGITTNGVFADSNLNIKSAAMVDVNGDGRTDIVIKKAKWQCSLGTNYVLDSCRRAGGQWSLVGGFVLYTSNGTSYAPAQTLGNFKDLRAVDLNGDGYTDIVYRYIGATHWYYRLSNGKAFTAEVKSSLSVADSNVNLTYFLDINQDGKADVLLPVSTTKWAIYITAPATTNTQVSFTKRGTRTFDQHAAIQFTDINADGKLDLLTSTDNAGWKVYVGSRPYIKEHAVSHITNGWGVTTAITYQSMVDKNVYVRRESGNKVSSDYFSPLTGMHVVSEVATETSAENTVKVEYQYGGLLLHKKGRGMLGFEELQTVDKQTGVLTRTVYHQLWPFTGIPKYTTQWLGDKQLSSAENALGYIDIAANSAVSYAGSGEVASKRVFPYVRSAEEYSYQLGSDLTTQYTLAKTNSSFVYDKYGNLASSAVVQSHPAEPNYRLSTITTNVYSGKETFYPRYGRLTRTTVNKTLVDAKGTQTNSRVSAFDYNDDLMLETETLAPGDVKYQVVTQHLYDTAGNSTSKTVTAASNADGTGVQSRSSSTLYDSRFRFVKQTTDALGYKTNFTYDSKSADTVTGRIDYVTQTGANNQVSRVYFDIVGRQIRSFSKGALSSDPEVNSYSAQDYCSAVSCGVSGAYARVRSWGDGQGEKQQYLDKFGREIATKVKLMDGTWSATYTTYDSQGRPKRSYEPYITTQGSYSEASYDALGRIEQTKLANGGFNTVAYEGLTSTTKDALNHSTTTLSDYAGLTRQITDHEGNKLEYFYDANGNLKSVTATDNAGISSVRTSNGYDTYGRKTSMVDQDKGSWTYDYNAFGELRTQKNAKGQITAFTYDEAGRQLRRHDPSGTTCWDYGDSEISYNRGKLVRLRSFTSTVNCDTTASADYEEIYSYNSRGLVANKLVRTAGSSFASSTSYDAYNRLYTLTYPSWSLSPSDDIVVRHEYSANNGMLTVLKDHKASSSQYYQKVMKVNARGQATEVLYGNGAKETRAFDADTGWVDTLNLYNKAGALAHSFEYQYQLNGNLDWREQGFGVNSNANFKEDFSYDTLDRLKTRTISNIGNSTAYNALPSTLRMAESYNYDNWGNITSKTNVGHYSYDASKTNRLTGVWSGANGTGSRYYNFAYDANGNIESDGKRSFTYTAFEKPSRITQGSNYTNFAYGPDRQLYRRTDLRDGKTTDTLYIDGLYERMTKSTGESEHKFYVGNAVITKRSNSAHSDILYLHKDNQGSTISITNAAGNVVQQFIYDSWGKQYSVSSNSLFSAYSNPGDSKGYTGHKMINDFDVIHMGGRTYNPILGRFMQADPFIQAPGNLQNYNRYSYVLNNPMSYTDPSGYFFKAIGKFVKKYWRVIVAAVVTYFTAGAASGWATSWAASMGMTSTVTIAGASATVLSSAGGIFVGAVSGAIAGAAGGFVATGSLRGTVTGAVSGAVFGGIGAGLSDASKFSQVAAHSVAGGVLSDLQGGKFGHGFVSAGIMKGIGKIQTQDSVGRTLIQAIAGGTVSKITGGKFANGALTAAIQYVVNEISAGKFSYTNNKSPNEYMEEKWKAGDVSVEFTTKLGPIELVNGEPQLAVGGKVGVLGAEIVYTKDDIEVGVTVGRDFGVAGAEAKGFATMNGKIGAEASVSLRYYEVTIKYVTEFQSIVSNMYHSSIALAEELYRDATKGGVR